MGGVGCDGFLMSNLYLSNVKSPVNMPDPLFLIAILPDLEIQQEVTAFKQECAQLFQASHSLNAPPHITLIPPFRWPLEQLESLKDVLLDFSYDQLFFNISLDGFNSFPPRVVFVGVKENEDLTELQSGLVGHLFQKLNLKSKRGHGYHPHMTIAHRDLQESVFPMAWEHFSAKNYKRLFRAEGVSLMGHRGGKWEILEQFAFG